MDAMLRRFELLGMVLLGGMQLAAQTVASDGAHIQVELRRDVPDMGRDGVVAQ